MAFSKKTWTDRVSEQPQRRLLTPTDGGTAMTVDVTRQEGMVIQEGDAFSAANMNNLETRIKNTFDSDEATINTINNRSTTNANNISTLQGNVNSVSARVTTNTNNINSVTTRVGTLENEFTANGKRLYMDYKNGKYGYNTSANRGADTFHPFNNVSEFTGGCAIDNIAYNTCKCYPGTYEYRAGGKGFGVYQVGVRIWVDDELVVENIQTGDGTKVFSGTFTVSNEGTMKTWGEGSNNTDMYYVWGGVWKRPSN